jgi:hypothetical protein
VADNKGHRFTNVSVVKTAVADKKGHELPSTFSRRNQIFICEGYYVEI